MVFIPPPDQPMFIPNDPASCEVEVTDPEVLKYLLGPDGEPIATLLDRRPVKFGFVKDVE